MSLKRVNPLNRSVSNACVTVCVLFYWQK